MRGHTVLRRTVTRLPLQTTVRPLASPRNSHEPQNRHLSHSARHDLGLVVPVPAHHRAGRRLGRHRRGPARARRARAGRNPGRHAPLARVAPPLARLLAGWPNRRRLAVRFLRLRRALSAGRVLSRAQCDRAAFHRADRLGQRYAAVGVEARRRVRRRARCRYAGALRRSRAELDDGCRVRLHARRHRCCTRSMRAWSSHASPAPIRSSSPPAA